jgi:RimJ/RimL family protein N-acetyltransferase
MRSAGIQSNRRARMGSEKGETGCRLPFSVSLEPAMTLLEDVFDETRRERGIPVLETERLTLRAPCRADVKTIAVLANDRRIAENTARIPHPYGIDDAEQFIESINKRSGEACFVITLDGALIGACGVDPREGGPEIGYWLGASYWGRGYATEAVRAVIDHAFGDLEHETLEAGARVSNPASRRVLEKCAFQWTGVGLYRIRAINSAAPIDRFRLDRGLWASLKSWGRVKRVA